VIRKGGINSGKSAKEKRINFRRSGSATLQFMCCYSVSLTHERAWYRCPAGYISITGRLHSFTPDHSFLSVMKYNPYKPLLFSSFSHSRLLPFSYRCTLSYPPPFLGQLACSQIVPIAKLTPPSTLIYLFLRACIFFPHFTLVVN
jgi:hypothetical protein